MKKFYEFLRSPEITRCKRRMCAATLAIMLASGIALHAAPSVQQHRERIDIYMKDATLEQVLLYVQNTSGYYVLFNSTEIKGVTGLNIDLRNATVAEVLRAALGGTSLTYSIEDDTIVVKGSARQPQNTVQQSPPVTVTGVIRQADGELLAGATVLIEGTGRGTTTDARGRFSLTFPARPDATLVVSYIGMHTRRIPCEGRTSFEIELFEDVQDISTVIVTGYADINVDKTASNVTVMRGEDLAKISPTSVLSAITAFEPSFRLKEDIAAGSNPNVLPEFTIRGETALNPDLVSDAGSAISRQSLLSNRNLPIFLVDGFEVDVERIYDMDPHRIETLSILKDASATALYGSRAANGIVVIQTKAPSTGKVTVDYNVTLTLHTPDLRSYNLMNAQEKVKAEFDGGYYTFSPEDYAKETLEKYLDYHLKLSNVARGVDTDWIAQGVRNVVNHRHDVNIHGGENNVRWNTNVNYNSGNGIMKGSQRNTYSVELHLRITLGNFILSNRARYGGQKGSESPFGSFSSYSHKQPYDLMIDEETGEYVHMLPTWRLQDTKNEFLNPIYEAANFNSYTENMYDNYSNQMQLRWNISPRFHITGSFFIDKKYSENRTFIDPRSKTYVNTTNVSDLGDLTLTERQVLSAEGRLQLSYNNTFGKHFIALNANGTIKQDKASQTSSHYKGFTSGHVSTPNAAARIVSKPGNRNQLQRKVSGNFYGNYSYNEIYLVDLTFAVDGNSEFGSKNKAAPFWSVAGAVQFHNYAFFRSETIDRLRLRASYGLLGRVPSTNSAARNIYENISLDDWYITGVGTILTAMGNPELRWEQTYLTDISAEIQMWKNRVFFKAGYYKKITNGQLAQVGVPSSSGFTYYWENMGKVQNEGAEVDFHVEAVRTTDLSLHVGAKLRHNRNKVLKLSDALKAYNTLVDEFFAGYRGSISVNVDDTVYGVPYKKFFEGQSTTVIAAMQSLGINPGNGNEVYRRPDGTITYTWNSADQIVVGDTEPDMSGTANLTVRWKRFDLLASFYFEFGAQAYNNTLVWNVENVNLLKQNADKRVNTMRWKEPGDLAPLKNIADRAYITRPTSRFVQDNNVFRSTSLDVGYIFKQDLVRSVGFSNIRLSFNTGELFFLSSIRRERGTSYPYERSYSFKVQASF